MLYYVSMILCVSILPSRRVRGWRQNPTFITPIVRPAPQIVSMAKKISPFTITNPQCARVRTIFVAHRNKPK